MKEDLEHLRLLAIFHYVMGGMGALFACFPVFHLGLGIAIVTGIIPPGKGGEQIPLFVGWLFIIVAGTIMALGWAYALCLLYAGRCLQAHRRHTFCFVMAVISCLSPPMGTVLGVFTILVLNRPSVQELFAASSSGANDEAGAALDAPDDSEEGQIRAVGDRR
jgi:hypothetical protein